MPRELLYKAKLHFLTWPQTPAVLEREDVFRLLQECCERANKNIKECFIARETHEDGSPHFHCVLKTDNRMNVYPDSFDLDFSGNILHGNYQACKDIRKACLYLSKEDNYVFSYGPLPLETIIAQRKSHSSRACAMVIANGGLSTDMFNEYPEMLLKAPQLRDGWNVYVQTKKAEEVTYDPPSTFYPWQQSLLQLISQDPDKRKIHWFVDFEGNTGKSEMARYMASEKNAIVYQGGAQRDILFGYQGQPIVVFDFSRERQDHISYATIETLKNGLFYNTKYECAMKVYKQPHVICFSNWEPDTSMLSADRWDIHEIQADKTSTQR